MKRCLFIIHRHCSEMPSTPPERTEVKCTGSTKGGAILWQLELYCWEGVNLCEHFRGLWQFLLRYCLKRNENIYPQNTL
jgi:hypothetical protein